MVRKDGAYLKTQRLNQIRQMVAQYGPIQKAELIPFIEVKIGLRTSTVESYLDLLVAARQVAYDLVEDTFSVVEPGE